MTTLSDFLKVNGVTVVQADDVNSLTAAALNSEFSNMEELTTTRVLLDIDTPIQNFYCDGSDHVVTAPDPNTTSNHVFFIVNSSTAGELITVMDYTETTVICVLLTGSAALIVPDGDGTYKTTAEANDSPIIPGGRLTLTSGTPVTIDDVLTSTNVYYTPYIHNMIQLWTGSAWKQIPFVETQLALGTVTSSLPYDVFAYLSSGDLALEKVAWFSNTSRSTDISMQDGRYCKTGDKTRLYLGSFYTINTTATADWTKRRLLFNAYNDRVRKLKITESTNTWSYSTPTWRPWNNSTDNHVEVMVGISDRLTEITFSGIAANTAGYSMGHGIGLDSTTTNHADTFTSAGSSGPLVAGVTTLKSYLSVGYHYLQALERGGNSGTTTFYGDGGIDFIQTGMVGWCMG